MMISLNNEHTCTSNKLWDLFMESFTIPRLVLIFKRLIDGLTKLNVLAGEETDR